jgi:hypothetical protein
MKYKSVYFSSGHLCYHWGNLAINRYEFKIYKHGESFFRTQLFQAAFFLRRNIP